jgi:hypothetical protein
MELLTLSIVSALSFAIGGLIVGIIFRRRLRNSGRATQELKFEIKQNLSDLKEQEEAIQKLIYNYHHNGLNPACKRLRGISNLTLRLCQSLKENLVLLAKPNHHGYATIASKDLEEVIQWVNTSNTICLQIEKEVLENANKFNHLQ